jgi:hypothetical protein
VLCLFGGAGHDSKPLLMRMPLSSKTAHLAFCFRTRAPPAFSPISIGTKIFEGSPFDCLERPPCIILGTLVALSSQG